MDPSGLILLAIIAVVAAIAYGQWVKAGWRRVLHEVADRYGLTYVQGGWLSHDRVEGTVEGFEVIVDSHTVSHGKSSTTYGRVRVETGLPESMSVDAEGVGSFFGKALRGPDIAVGDPAFDSRAYVRGDEVEVVSRMNAPARAAVHALLALPAGLAKGTVTHQQRGRFKTTDDIARRLDPLLDFARATRAGDSPAGRLGDNATGDPMPGVRRRALELLDARFPDHPETARVARAALADPVAEVRLAAALITDDPAAAQAALVALLNGAEHDIPVRLTAACRLGELAPDHPALAAHTGWLLAQLGAFEPHAVLAARALGLFADVTAVEPLLAHTRGVFKDGRLKDAARVAIAAIQGRTGGVGGGLSLVEPAAAAAGGLSVAVTDQEREEG